jgi:hypothetical protein
MFIVFSWFRKGFEERINSRVPSTTGTDGDARPRSRLETVPTTA